MKNFFLPIFLFLLTLYLARCDNALEVGEYCGAPSGPIGSSWGVLKGAVQKTCPSGTTCRKGACNCDDLPDGTILGISREESNGNTACRRVAGQKCSSDEECFHNVACISNVCTCPQDVHCQSHKKDWHILA